jgi:hypothetical protein
MSLFTSDAIPSAQITNPARTVGDAAGTMNQIIAEYGGHVEHTIDNKQEESV